MSGDVNPGDWIPFRRTFIMTSVTAFLSNVSLLLIITCRRERSITAGNVSIYRETQNEMQMSCP
jgi:hypothetical protein